jgi:spore coat-associated protein N
MGRGSLLTLVATLAVALGAFGLALAAPGNPRLAAQLTATGALGLTSSRDGQTLFDASGMRPGQSVTGTLRVTNTGATPEILVLAAGARGERHGSGGGVLSGRLVLTVSDVTRGAPATLWTGRATDLGQADIAVLATGQSRDLEVSAALPSAGVGNAYQDASLSLGLNWGVRAAAPTRTASPTPTPVATIAAPARTPAATPAPPAARALDVAPEALGLPSAARCASRRKFRIHLRAPGGRRIVLAVVQVGRRAPKQIAGRGRQRVGARVSLRGMRKRKVTVRVEVRTTDAHRYRAKRTYRTCGR